MGGTSRVIMGAMVIMVVILAIILGLVLVLLAELYCSLLLRRKKLRSTDFITTTPPTATTTTTITESWQRESQSGGGSSLNSFYSQGVLQPPRTFLFPELSNFSNKSNMDLENQQNSQPLHCSSVMYICNPMYDNDANRASKSDTPFETPETSPSRLDTVDSSSEEDDDNICQGISSGPSSPTLTPRLTPMKNLPAKACSISLRDAMSLGISGSDSNSHIDDVSSSSSSVTPCTSSSW